MLNKKNSQDLIYKIEKFLSLTYEEKKNMGLEGRKKVDREFDRSFVVNAYINEIEKIESEQNNGL